MTMTLTQAAAAIQYDAHWGIWASLEEGKFSADSDARYGQTYLEGGGMIDDYLFFGNGEKIQDYLSEWGDADELIDNINQQFEA